MSKILLIGDDPRRTTGFGKVTKQVQSFLSFDHDVYVLAYNPVAGSTVGTRIFRVGDPTIIGTDQRLSSEDGYGRFSSAILTAQLKFDMIITIGDPWYFSFIERMKIAFPEVIYVSYFPSEAKTQPYFVTAGGSSRQSIIKMQRLIDQYDHLIAYSKFSMNQIKGNCKNYIYHSMIETDMEDTTETDLDLSAFEDKFVIGSVMRMQYRKGVDQLIRTMLVLKQKYPQAYKKAVMYIHAPRIDAHNVEPKRIAEAWGIDPDKILMTDDVYPHIFRDESGKIDITRALSRSHMNQLMKRFNVYLAPSFAEGFNLPLLEAAYLGVPCMYTDAFTMGEIMDGIATPMPVYTEFMEKQNERVFAMPNMDKAAEIIDSWIKDPKKIQVPDRKKILARFSDEQIGNRWLSTVSKLSKPKVKPANILFIYQQDRETEYVVAELRKLYEGSSILEVKTTDSIVRDSVIMSLNNNIDIVEIVHSSASVLPKAFPELTAIFCKKRPVEVNLNFMSTDLSKLKDMSGKFSRIRMLERLIDAPEMKEFRDQKKTLLEPLLLPTPVYRGISMNHWKMFLGAHEDNYGLAQAIEGTDLYPIIRKISTLQPELITENFFNRVKVKKKLYTIDDIEHLTIGATIYVWHIKNREYDFYLEMLIRHNTIIMGSQDNEGGKYPDIIVCKNVNDFIDKINNKEI